MAEFAIKPQKIRTVFGELEKQEQDLKKAINSLESVKSALSSNDYGNIRYVLDIQIAEVERERCGIKNLRTSLQDIVKLYEDTEAGVGGMLLSGQLPDYGKGLEQYFNDNFSGNITSDFISKLLESGGNFAVRIAGLTNEFTALARGVGKNSFIILNPSVAEKTSKLIKGGTWVTNGVKYGVPILGGIIDFIGQMGQGADAKDALIKSGAHVAIGLAGGEAGAAIGAALGSVIPGAGTVIGGVVGFVAGTAITMIGSYTFDYLYDNWDTVVEKVSDVWNDATEAVSDLCDNIGNAVSGTFNYLGTVFG